MKDEIYHHGVKGMKWGVWNEETARRRKGDNVKQQTINKEVRDAIDDNDNLYDRLQKTYWNSKDDLDDKKITEKQFNQIMGNAYGKALSEISMKDTKAGRLAVAKYMYDDKYTQYYTLEGYRHRSKEAQERYKEYRDELDNLAKRYNKWNDSDEIQAQKQKVLGPRPGSSEFYKKYSNDRQKFMSKVDEYYEKERAFEDSNPTVKEIMSDLDKLESNNKDFLKKYGYANHKGEIY